MTYIFKPGDKAYWLRHTRMKALKDMIETAVREMKAEAINPEVIQAAKEGAEYRRKTQAILGRGW